MTPNKKKVILNSKEQKTMKLIIYEINNNPNLHKLFNH